MSPEGPRGNREETERQAVAGRLLLPAAGSVEDSGFSICRVLLPSAAFAWERTLGLAATPGLHVSLFLPKL